MTYKIKISYTFTAGGAEYEITDWSESVLEIEETRKNGQEDSHFSIFVVKARGEWELGPSTKEFLEPWEVDEASQVLEYLNKNNFQPQHKSREEHLIDHYGLGPEDLNNDLAWPY